MHQYHHHHTFQGKPGEEVYSEHRPEPCGCSDGPARERPEECRCQDKRHSPSYLGFGHPGAPGAGPHGGYGGHQELPREGTCAPHNRGGPMTFRRRFFTREEKIGRLLNYLDALYAEAEAVEERLAGLGVDLDALVEEASEEIEDEASIEDAPADSL